MSDHSKAFERELQGARNLTDRGLSRALELCAGDSRRLYSGVEKKALLLAASERLAPRPEPDTARSTDSG